MGSVDTWTDQYRVTSFQTDKYARIRISSVAQFLQESAWRHAEACQAGYKDLLSKQKLWVLYALKIRIQDYPLWDDMIQLDTWGKSFDGLFAGRDFEIKNQAGDILVTASSTWMIIDSLSHKPCRIPDSFRTIPVMERSSGAGTPQRLKGLDNAIKISSYPVLYSHIDIYQHVNNSRYIEWCENLLPIDIWEHSEISELEINFLSESLPGNILDFYSDHADETIYRFTAQNKNTGREVFRADVRLRKRERMPA